MRPRQDHPLMCCSQTVSRIGPRAVEILTLAGFIPSQGDSRLWRREAAPEQLVQVILNEANIQINLLPGVTDRQDHYDRKEAAALAFKLAAFLAEDAGAVVTQHSTVQPCLNQGRPSQIVIANYPERPLRFEAICAGFQEVFLGLDVNKGGKV